MPIMNLYMTDDMYRPDDGNGNPIEQSSSELSISIGGYQYAWYFSARCSYDIDNADPNAKLIVQNYLFLNGSSPSTAPTLRFILQTSSNDFSTYHQEVLDVQPFYGNSIDIRSRESFKSIKHQYGSAYNRSCSKTLYMTDLGLSDIQYKVRCKIQRQVNGAWTDVIRSGTNPWKTLTSYAPFYQTVTPPTHFYANGINTFGTRIKSNHKFRYSYNVLESSDGYFIYESDNEIVRSITPPYATNGVETQYLYWCPGHSVSDEGAYQKYSCLLQISVDDPSDSNYSLIVAQRYVGGDVEYKTSDDLSMYGTPTWSITDPTGMYERYGVFLRNVTTQFVLSLNIPVTYGAQVRTYYIASDGYSGSFQQDENAHFNSVTIPLSRRGSPESITIRAYAKGFGSTLLDDHVNIQIISYGVPSLPIASIHRCDSDGTANDNGDHCRIDWAVSITSINNQNSKKLTIRHPEGTTEFDPLDSYTQSGSLIVAASTESTYGIDFTVTDDLNTITKSLRLSTAQAVLDLLYGGGGVAFGKVANVQDAVEISELWKLICYKLMLNGIDMNKWVKQLESRVGALEQYVGHGVDTTQYQVSFYNGSELLDRQWIAKPSSGYPSITDPIEAHRIDTPTKEPTETATYSYAGWSKDDDGTVDPDALTNITANRDLYAVFTSSTRLYTVNFKADNASEPIKTEELRYSYSATAPSTNPSKSGYVFAGWCPSGRIVTKNTDAIAQFFDNTEIADSWEEIMESVNDGTVSKRYNQGQYKTLDCGSNGTVIVRIKGFNLDKIANSSKTAKVSWEAIECLAQTRRINPIYNAGEEGTGALGGWGKSELRQWLNGEFFNSIDPVVRNSIKSVSKVSFSRDVNGIGVINNISLDKIFIPSAEEISGHYDQRGYIYETDGIDFRYMTSAFSNKRANGSASYIDYWLRTVGNVGWDSFRYYQDLANKSIDTSEKLKGICIGFCT